jgi:tRNA(Ile)-lysidine synthase
MKLQNLNFENLKPKSILLAHSGGVDSCVLAHLLLANQINFSVAHCNFQLRGAESVEDAGFVRHWCNQNGITHYSVSFSSNTYKNYHKISVQMAARELRYKWFSDLMDVYEFDTLLTAHHLNDQLETFLINTSRGTGISGLLGISNKNSKFRPLLKYPKSELIKYAKKEKIKWREDASNQDVKYLRNRIRSEVVSPLMQIQPNLLENFQTTLNNLNQANTFIHSILDEFKTKVFSTENGVVKLNIEEINKLPQIDFCLHYWFSPLEMSAGEVLKLLKASSGKILYSKSHRLIRDRKCLILTDIQGLDYEQFQINLEDISQILPLNLQWKDISNDAYYSLNSDQALLDKNLLKKPLYLRKFRKGDYFCPIGMKGKKSLSKFFKDEKYSQLEKEKQWLLCSEDEIIWVIGKRCDRRFTANQKTENTILMTVT